MTSTFNVPRNYVFNRIGAPVYGRCVTLQRRGKNKLAQVTEIFILPVPEPQEHSLIHSRLQEKNDFNVLRRY